MALSFIDELNPQKDSWNIKVRIIRLWRQSYQIDMILMDEKGAKIHAVVKKHLIKNFEMLLGECSAIFLSKFGLAENIDKYPTLKHPYKLNFYRNTVVKQCLDFEGSVFGFRFASFDDIINNSDELDLTIDVIGHVSCYGDIDVYTRNGKEGKRISLMLEDLEGRKVPCTLWDNFAQQVASFIETGNTQGLVFIIIQLGKIRMWQGKSSVQNSLYGCRLFINEDMEEINEFRRRFMFKSGSDPSSQLASHLLVPKIVNTFRDEYLKNTERKYVDELGDIRKEDFYVVLGTIKSIDGEYGWYYPGCRHCFTKVVHKSQIVNFEDIDWGDADVDGCDKLWCRKCKIEAKLTVPVFKVQVRVQDSTGTASFVLFNREVSRIISKSAYELREKQEKDGDVDALPEELYRLINKKYIFKLKVSTINFRSDWYPYTVAKVCDDELIIREMQKKDEAEQDMIGSEPDLDSMKVDDSSQGCFDTKDTVSFTGECSE